MASALLGFLRRYTGPNAMRIRMIEPRRAHVDGVDLSSFHPGHAYEVDPSIASYLIVSGVAEPCSEDAPALVVKTSEVIESVFAGSAARADVADDWDDDGGSAA
jgi:hypothetical protein